MRNLVKTAYVSISENAFVRNPQTDYRDIHVSTKWHGETLWWCHHPSQAGVQKTHPETQGNTPWSCNVIMPSGQVLYNHMENPRHDVMQSYTHPCTFCDYIITQPEICQIHLPFVGHWHQKIVTSLVHFVIPRSLGIIPVILCLGQLPQG